MICRCCHRETGKERGQCWAESERAEDRLDCERIHSDRLERERDEWQRRARMAEDALEAMAIECSQTLGRALQAESQCNEARVVLLTSRTLRQAERDFEAGESEPEGRLARVQALMAARDAWRAAVDAEVAP